MEKKVTVSISTGRLPPTCPRTFHSDTMVQMVQYITPSILQALLGRKEVKCHVSETMLLDTPKLQFFENPFSSQI